MHIEAQSVFEFVQECNATLRHCYELLGFPEDEFSLDALVNLARKGRVPRRGSVGRTALEIDYHIHGSGYTMTNRTSGKELRFDARNEEGQLRITINAWELQQFLGSEEPLPLIEAELRRLSLECPALVHVHDDPITYFYCTDL